MPKYADYIKRIEIDSLWSGKKHIVWELNRHVNILSGTNGAGKSTILNKVVKGLSAGGEFPSHMLKGVRLDVEPEDAKWIRYDLIRSLDSNLQQTFSENTGFLSQAMTALAGVGAGSLLDMQLFQLQRFGQLAEPFSVIRLRDPVDFPQQRVTVQDRHVPPELHPLAEDNPDPPYMFPPFFPGNPPVHKHFASVRRQNAGKNLDGG